MDEVKIRTPFMKSILGKLLSKLIRKKLGRKIDIWFNEISIENYENELKFKISASGSMSKEELTALLKELI